MVVALPDPSPESIVDAQITPAGDLVVIDARGTPWKYDPLAVDSGSNVYTGPASFAAAFITNERLTVMDAAGAWWTYLWPQHRWARGYAVSDRIVPSNDANLPWKQYRSVRVFKPGAPENQNPSLP